ncbi:GNAT family N-acetyltransferase [Actinomadura graeca]|uniref:GNAT family N-acetyltransferase n=1 Tax=Actinomadura graeca TaxID=2750812 RepID=A0ABX8QV13_9ACTN|nr:GNAT family N-acetyltransferase [Actinomadura graeca]QXJ22625.1 GNAT family N-acetyltransferase [Actinomadura graeca]
MNVKIERVEGASLDVDTVIAVYDDSGLGERRPTRDRGRMAAMLANADIVMAAYADGELVGIARSISDFSYATYLSDIAVARSYQRSGVGRALISATRQEAPSAKLILLSAPAAVDYYPHIGFRPHHSAWTLESWARSPGENAERAEREHS